MRHDIDDGTSLATPVSTAGALAGVLDTSAAHGPAPTNTPSSFTIYLTAEGLADGDTARIAIEDGTILPTTGQGAVAGDMLPLAVFHFQGPISTPITESKRCYELADARFGTALTKLRVNVLACSTGAKLSVHAQADY